MINGYGASLAECDCCATGDYDPEPGPSRAPYDSCLNCGHPKGEHEQ